MPTWYLTPAALSYLGQLILALLIAGYFVGRLLTTRVSRPAHQTLLTGFFVCIALLTLLFGLDAAFSPTDRLYPLFPQTTVLALGILLLLQFAYHFPQPFPHKWEVRLVLGLSLAYLLYEAGYAVYRFYLLSAWGFVIYRPPWADYPMALGLLWAPIVLLRQSLRTPAAANPSGLRDPKGLLRLLIRPQDPAARAAREMALIYLAVFGISLLNILRTFYFLPPQLFQIILSLGAMLALAAFAVVYLNALPETASFMVRLVGVALVVLLAALSAVGWLITPSYAAEYRPVFPDQRTLRFTPNAAGGYDASLAPFRFERDLSTGSGQGLGTNLGLRDSTSPTERATVEGSARLAFTFPFHGRTYDAVYVNHDGAIAIGRNVHSPWIYPDYVYRYGSYTPFLFPLLLDLIPEAGGEGSGVYARQEADRLIVTWERVPAFHRRENVFTFQAVLYSSGVFEFSYDGLPADLAYRPGDEPLANVWAIGATSPSAPFLAGGAGGAGPQYVDFGSLASGDAIRSGPQGVMQDYYLDFRRYLHALLLPLAYLIVAASALAIVGFSTVFHRNLVRSLNALLAGARRINAGDLQTAMPIYYHDEIGFLTESFNSAVAAQRDLIATLEERVASRTQALSGEMAERQAAQAQLMVQERALAAAEEREHLGRDLHDGLGQMLGYLNLQAQTVETLLDQGKVEGARTNLHQMAQAAQQAHTDVRSFILGFRAAARRSFGETLQETVVEFERQAGIPVAVEAGQPWDTRWLSPVAEVHLLRIIQEALNNIRKHAQAQHVTLALAQEGDRLRVTVADDGVGFRISGFGFRIAESTEETSIPNPPSLIPNHFGLTNMHDRSAELCGTLTIESAPGRGTRVILECPIQTPCLPATVPASPLRVLLVDDHPMFLDGLRNLLTAHGMEVVGLGQDGLEAQTLARMLRPDLIVMDLHMPGCDGLEATRRIKAEWPEATIVILTVSAAEEDLFAALQAGAAGYLLKNLTAEEFFLLLAGLEHGAPPIAPELAARIQGELGQAALQRGQLAALNPVQTDVLRLVAQGLTYHEVGRHLHLSESAVKYHMKQILERLHLANRGQAEAYARRSGLGGDTATG